MGDLKAPFPYFGGKSKIADEVWCRFGNVDSYVEPFCGSSAVLLARPDEHCWWERTETINDKDGLIANFWRALQHDPEAVAHYADWPTFENDLHARHAWLIGQKDSLQTKLEGDPEFYDAKIAGWWCWGMSQWIGGGFCSGSGPWHVVNGELVQTADGGAGICRGRTNLNNDGQGINRKRIQLGSEGVARKQLLKDDRCLPDDVIGSCSEGIVEYLANLANRLRRVRVCCGDWSRVCGKVPLRLTESNTIGVFLDPPYAKEQGRVMNLYRLDDGEVAYAVRDWAIEMGKNPKLKIAYCGYEGLEFPPDWEEYHWKANGGYAMFGNKQGRINRFREVVWFSPGCEEVTGRLL